MLKFWQIRNSGSLFEKDGTMKKLIFILLLSCGAYAQQEVYNVQQYCIDSIPFKKGQCDISGNEYSFVFLDSKKNEVVFFLTDTKIKYTIRESYVDEKNPNFKWYILDNEKGTTEMKINKQKTKIEFYDPSNHIFLTVGKSTKIGMK